MVGNNWMAICKHINLSPYLMPHTKINSERIIYLNVRTKITKFLQENTGKKSLVTLGLAKVT